MRKRSGVSIFPPKSKEKAFGGVLGLSLLWSFSHSMASRCSSAKSFYRDESSKKPPPKIVPSQPRTHCSSDETDLRDDVPQWCKDLEFSDDQSESSTPGEFVSTDSEVEETMSDHERKAKRLRKRKRAELRAMEWNKKHSSGKDLEDIKDDIKSMKGLLEKVCDKVESNTAELQKIQSKRSASTSSSSNSSPEKLSAVRKEVRQVYKALIDNNENFQGWLFGPGSSINSRENQATMTELIKEVKGSNPSFDSADIRAAAHRFYKSRNEAANLDRSGKAESKKVHRRRHERISRKRKEREAIIQKNGKFTEDQREQWLQVTVNDYMSSEESEDDDTIVIRPLPWRSSIVNKMFSKIDTYCNSKKSPQALRQMKERRIGRPSDRPRPKSGTPTWAIQAMK